MTAKEAYNKYKKSRPQAKVVGLVEYPDYYWISLAENDREGSDIVYKKTGEIGFAFIMEILRYNENETRLIDISELE